MKNKTDSFISLNISVFIISDTRNEKSDKSGKILEDRIKTAGHKMIEKKIILALPTRFKFFT